jgi:hypothetical protein
MGQGSFYRQRDRLKQYQAMQTVRDVEAGAALLTLGVALLAATVVLYMHEPLYSGESTAIRGRLEGFLLIAGVVCILLSLRRLTR